MQKKNVGEIQPSFMNRSKAKEAGKLPDLAEDFYQKPSISTVLSADVLEVFPVKSGRPLSRL